MATRVKPTKLGSYRAAPVVARVRRTAVQAYGDADEWHSQSRMCIQLAGHRCSLCGALQSSVKLQAHHVIPVSRGGRTTQSNLRCLCVNCHARQPGHNHLTVRK